MKSGTFVRFAAGAAALAAASAVVQGRVRSAERVHQPLGRFVTAGGVRLHYVEQGDGPPLVLLHGLGSMVEDFLLSGLVREASRRYRVIAFDRPGYGHSERPRRFKYGPLAQARLIDAACRDLDARRPMVLAHSWGTLVALAWALDRPGAIRSLVLASGLYFPTPRLDAPLLMPPALPLIGDLMAHTLSPVVGRALWPMWLRLIFGPAPVPAHFSLFPTWLALRPAQLRATAEDAAVTLPTVTRFLRHYQQLSLPVTLVAGERDRFVSTRAHSARLHAMLPTSRLLVSPHSGHMVHHTDLPLVMSALEAAGPVPV